MGEIELLTVQTAQVPFEWIILRSLPQKCKMFLDSKFESWLPKTRQFEGHLIHLFKECTGHACSNVLRMGCFNISFFAIPRFKLLSLLFPFRFLTAKQPRAKCWIFPDVGMFHLKHGGLHLGPEPRRVTCVAVKIPPLPYGPLSVAWVVEVVEIQLDWSQVGWLDGSNLVNILRSSGHPKGWWKESGNWIPHKIPLGIIASDIRWAHRMYLKICQLKILGVSPFFDLHDAYNPHKALHVISLALGFPPLNFLM